MSTNPKYTFLLPAYKAKYFEEALRSIMAQTCTDFKVLVSDDCSPENLKPIFDRVCGDDPRFAFRRNDENMGGRSLVAHWNLLVGLCDTEWLIMASDDDVYDPRFLEEMDALQRRYPEVDLLHARTKLIDGTGEVVKHDSAYDERVSQIEFLAFLGKTDHIECVANYAYRTARLRDIGGFVDYPLAWCSDTATNNLMAANGCATTQEMLFSFRMSGTNITSIDKREREVAMKKLQACEQFYAHIKQLFSQFPKNGSKLYEHQLKMAYESQKAVVYASMFYYGVELDLRPFVRLVRYMRHEGVLTSRYEVYRMYAKWFYAWRRR